MLQQLILEKDWMSNYRGIAIWMGLNIIDAASTYICDIFVRFFVLLVIRLRVNLCSLYI